MPGPKPFDRDVRSGRIKLCDIHWDGHAICVKARVSDGDRWVFGRGDTFREAIKDFYANWAGDDLI